MDDFTYSMVSLVAAGGSILGTYVGFTKLLRERRSASLDGEHQEQKSTSVMRRNANRSLHYANDFTRIIGFIGMHSLFGMVVYPWMPLYLLGNVLRRTGAIGLASTQ